eukprot:516097_1
MLHRRLLSIAAVSIVVSTTQATDCKNYRKNYKLLGDLECEAHYRGYGWMDWADCRKSCIANSKCAIWHVNEGDISMMCCLHTNSDNPVTAGKPKIPSFRGYRASGTRGSCVNACTPSELKVQHVKYVADCPTNTFVGETCDITIQPVECPNYFSKPQKVFAKCDWTPEAEAKRNFTQFTKWSVDVDNPCTLDVSKIIQTILVALGVTIVISALGFYIWKKHYVPYMAAKEPNVVREEIPNHLRYTPSEPVKKNISNRSNLMICRNRRQRLWWSDVDKLCGGVMSDFWHFKLDKLFVG